MINLTAQGRDARYVAQLVERLKPQMENSSRCPRILVYIVDATEIEAGNTPGGTLVFFRGLIEVVESEAALVGIIGHVVV